MLRTRTRHCTRSRSLFPCRRSAANRLARFSGAIWDIPAIRLDAPYRRRRRHSRCLSFERWQRCRGYERRFCRRPSFGRAGRGADDYICAPSPSPRLSIFCESRRSRVVSPAVTAAIRPLKQSQINALCLNPREAPSLDFVEVMLAGLARDGGLYVPERWPRLDRSDRWFCRPALCRSRRRSDPAVRRRRSLTRDLARMAQRGLWQLPPSGHGAASQFGANHFLLELFHGPTLAFKDLAMQFLARLMDHALAQRGERTTIVVATSGDTGGAAVEAFRGRGAGRPRCVVPARPHLRRPAADDDDGARRQCACDRDRRHI